VAGLLLSKSGARDLLDGDNNGSEVDASETQPEALTVAGATDFDPSASGGDGHEHGDELAALTDRKADTLWDTEWYRDRDLGNLKPGVGFYLTLDQASKIQQVKLSSPSKGWSVEIYVANSPANALEGWGQPRAHKENIPAGNVTLDLPDGGVQGGAVLVWFTHLGEAPTDTGQFRVEVSEIQVLG
jgi:putative peptidoglycan lipid II flippase